MPASTSHETLLVWLRDAPDLVDHLVAGVGGGVPHAGWTLEDSALREAYPVEVHPDLVLRDASAGRWMIVEVQLQPDADKARRWPLMMAVMGNRHGVDGQLVVITRSASVAAWALDVGLHPGRLGAVWGVVPAVLHLGEAEALRLLDHGPPELAAVAAWIVEGRDDEGAERVVRRALARVAEVEAPALRELLIEGILHRLTPRLAALVRSTMVDLSSLPKNPVIEEWKAELRAEGRVEGRVEGLLQADRDVLRLVLGERGFDLSPDVDRRIEASADRAQLHRWTARAVRAATLGAVFEDG